MSGKMMEWAIEQDCTGITKLVLIALAHYHRPSKPEPFPAFDTMAKLVGVSERSVRRSVDELEKLGLVSVKRSTGYHSNSYRLQIKPGQGVHDNPDTVSAYGGENPDNLSKEPGQSVTNTRTQCPTNKDIRKDIRKRERKRATSTPAKFPLTESLQQWAGKNAPGIDLKTETEKFLDYHRAKGNTHRDWTAAFRNWLRNAVKFQQQKPEQQSAIPDDPYEAASR